MSKSVPHRGVYVVTVNFQQDALTAALLASFEPSTVPVHMIVVDVMNDPNRTTWKSDHFLSFEVVSTADNRGFSANLNYGLRRFLEKEEAEYVWILNNDCVVDKDCVAAQLNKMGARQDRCVLGSKVCFHREPDTIQAAGGASLWPFLAYDRQLGRGIKDSVYQPKTDRLDMVYGASIFTSKQVLQDVGLFDERFFLYFEEMDWSLRCRKLEIPLIYCPESKVLHHEGGTIGGDCRHREGYFMESRYSFIQKYYPNIYFFNVLVLFFLIFMKNITNPTKIGMYLRKGRKFFVKNEAKRR